MQHSAIIGTIDRHISDVIIIYSTIWHFSVCHLNWWKLILRISTKNQKLHINNHWLHHKPIQNLSISMCKYYYLCSRKTYLNLFYEKPCVYLLASCKKTLKMFKQHFCNNKKIPFWMFVNSILHLRAGKNLLNSI